MKSYYLLIFLLMVACNASDESASNSPTIDQQIIKNYSLNLEDARQLIALPLACILQEYPNKLGQVIAEDSSLKTPQQLRPIFYGCFDWHSAVHGYWSIVYLMKKYPVLIDELNLIPLFNQMLTAEHIEVERSFFQDEHNQNFERTYGWAWLFKLYQEIDSWEDFSEAQEWAKNLEPLVNLLEEKYISYLPQLTYPIRTGTHDNTAFSLSMFLDYAHYKGDRELISFLEHHTKRFFKSDQLCPISYEPSGHDFLSACLEEAALMSKVLNNEEYSNWLVHFLPSLWDESFDLKVGKVTDRTDGHLVHLDGLNFSRAAILFALSKKLPQYPQWKVIANQLYKNSIVNIQEDDYMGSHWLASFALLALDQMEEEEEEY